MGGFWRVFKRFSTNKGENMKYYILIWAMAILQLANTIWTFINWQKNNTPILLVVFVVTVMALLFIIRVIFSWWK